MFSCGLAHGRPALGGVSSAVTEHANGLDVDAGTAGAVVSTSAEGITDRLFTATEVVDGVVCLTHGVLLV